MDDLDIEVAEKVMGLSKTSDDCPLGQGSCPGQWDGRCLPPYSKDQNLAMDVVDKIINLIPDTCTIDIHGIFPGNGDYPRWWAGFDGLWDEETVLGRGDGQSPAEAICRAALDFVSRQPTEAK